MAKIIANELERFRRDIQDAQQRIMMMEQTFKNMFDEINALTGMWEGIAHETYISQFQADVQNMEQVFNNLKTYKESLDEAHAKFSICEQQVEDVVSRVQV